MPGKSSKKKSASKVTVRGRGRAPGQKNRTKPVASYSTYIYKVLKQVAEGKQLKKSSMSTLNSVVNDIFARIATEAGALCRYKKSQTLGANEVRCATKLVLPAELATHAHQEGDRALAKFKAATR